MSRLRFEEGKEIIYDDASYLITRVIDHTRLAIKNKVTNKSRIVNRSEIQLEENEQLRNQSPNIESLTSKQLKIANWKYEIIKPLIDKKSVKEDIQKLASVNDVGASTIYKWLQTYHEKRTITSLASSKRGNNGKKRLDDQIELIIYEAIEDNYLVLERNRVSKTVEAVQAICYQKDLKPPHSNTIKHRIHELSEYQKTKRRFGPKIAREKFEPIQSTQVGRFPLDIVEIDHTILDIQVVDEDDRYVIGRPTITVAIDTFSRMVLGFYVSFQKPSAMSVAMCVANAILDKSTWLAKNNIPGDWPCYGFMRVLRADNGKDFHSKALKEACKTHNIQLEWRRKGDPKSGGAYIERYIGTVNNELHSIPGSTFSNVVEKGRYDSEDRAIMSLSALHNYIGDFIINTYHLKKHSQLGVSPIEMWNIGIMGSAEQPGVGLPDRWMDHQRLMLDFMPFEERTIQQYGVVINHIKYWGAELMPYVHSVIPGKGRQKIKRTFKFKYDPSDLSKVYFYDPNIDEYAKISYADKRNPVISLWQLRDALKEVKKSSVEINQEQIFASYFRRKELVENEKKKTKSKKRKINRTYEVKPLGMKEQLQNHTAEEKKGMSGNEDSDELFLDIEAFDFD